MTTKSRLWAVATLLTDVSVTLAVVFLGSAPVSAELRQPSDHVVLISFDGLRPEFYLDERWPAPMLQTMRTEGAHAVAVRGIFPTVTYPTHTTMITGVLPATHGIFYNAPFEPEGVTGRWYWEEEYIRVETLWDAARRAGLKTASVFWPVSVGAPIDYNVPEIWPLEDGVDFLEPIRALSHPPGLLEELEREATGKLSSKNFSFGKLTLDDRSSEMAAYLLTRYRPNFLTLHLIGADTLQHEHGRESPEVRLAVAAMDRAVARIVEAARREDILNRTTFIVTGDHGFVDLDTSVAPNVWLIEAGLMEDKPDRGEWRATVHNTSAAGFVHLANPEDERTLAATRLILNEQEPEIRALYTILEREDLAAMNTAPDAALGIAPASGVYISSRTDPPAIRPKSGASHGHVPETPQIETGFVAWGAGIQPGARVKLMDIDQIAPLVSRLLGLSLQTPKDPPTVLTAETNQSGTTPP